jgi:hypothetical protein
MLNQRFTFLCNEDERDGLTNLAKILHRSQGDTIRLLIRNAIRMELSKTDLDEVQMQKAKIGTSNNFRRQQ